MPRGFALRAAVLLLMLPACAEAEQQSSFSTYTRKELTFRTYNGLPVYEGNDPNSRFTPLLLPNEMQFDRVYEGQELALNSVIVMPGLGEGGALTIEFRRSDLEERFIRDMFFDSDPKVLARHPFASAGVEAILTDERLILNLDPGVALHLRNDMMYSSSYRTFSRDDVVGKITKVDGEIFYSSDHAYIKMKMIDFYTSTIEIEVTRSYEPVVPPVERNGPSRHPPKVIEGP